MLGLLAFGAGSSGEAVTFGTDADARARWSVGKRTIAGGAEAELGAPQLITLVHTTDNHVRLAVGGATPWTAMSRAPRAGAHAPVQLGASGSVGGAPWSGALLALLVYERALPDGEREAVEAWLAGRHGAWHPKAPWLDALPSDARTLANTHRWSRAEADAWVAWRDAHPGVAIPGDGLALWIWARAWA